MNPSLAKGNLPEEHEEHKRLLVSTAFRKRSIGDGREIFCLTRWRAEVLKDPAPVLVNSRLTLVLTGLATSGDASEDRKSARRSIVRARDGVHRHDKPLKFSLHDSCTNAPEQWLFAQQ